MNILKKLKERQTQSRVYNYIAGCASVHLGDIEAEFGHGNYYLKQSKNVILWQGLTENIANALQALLQSKKIILVSTTPEAALGGRELDMPIADFNVWYTTPHFLPVDLWTTASRVGTFNPADTRMYRSGGWDV